MRRGRGGLGLIHAGNRNLSHALKSTLPVRRKILSLESCRRLFCLWEAAPARTGSSWEPEPAWTGTRTALAVPTGSAQSITLMIPKTPPKPWMSSPGHRGCLTTGQELTWPLPSALKYQMEPSLRVGENQLNSRELSKIPHRDTSGAGGRGL